MNRLGSDGLLGGGDFVRRGGLLTDVPIGGLFSIWGPSALTTGVGVSVAVFCANPIVPGRGGFVADIFFKSIGECVFFIRF